MKICIPTSSGGHLTQVMTLKPWWGRYERFFVAYQTPDADYFLKEERRYVGFGPEHHSVRSALLNFFLALFVLIRERPSLVFSFGAGLSAPFYWAAWILHIPSIYIEPYDFIVHPSLTARIVAPFTTFLFVQHQSLCRAIPGAVFGGSLL